LWQRDVDTGRATAARGRTVAVMSSTLTAAWRTLTAAGRALVAAARADLRGWLVCAAVLAVTVVRSGVTYSFGMFVVRLQQQFPHLNFAEQSTSQVYTAVCKQTASPARAAPRSISVSKVRWQQLHYQVVLTNE